MDRRKKKERKQQERQEANKDEPNLPPSDAGATSDQVYNPTQRHTDYQHEQYEPGNLSLPPPMEQSEGPRQQRRSVNEQRRLDSLRQETSSTAMSFHQSVIDLHAAEQEQGMGLILKLTSVFLIIQLAVNSVLLAPWPYDDVPSENDDIDLDTSSMVKRGYKPVPFPCNGYDSLARCQHGGKGPRKTWTKSGRFCVCLCPNKWIGPECGYAESTYGK